MGQLEQQSPTFLEPQTGWGAPCAGGMSCLQTGMLHSCICAQVRHVPVHVHECNTPIHKHDTPPNECDTPTVHAYGGGDQSPQPSPGKPTDWHQAAGRGLEIPELESSFIQYCELGDRMISGMKEK